MMLAVSVKIILGRTWGPELKSNHQIVFLLTRENQNPKHVAMKDTVQIPTQAKAFHSENWEVCQRLPWTAT